jgi:SAM-dependent methyltransferase
MERTYGRLYDRLTSTALEEIAERLPRPGAIVDYGAGCGRLTLPLAAAGHRVTAVEPSAPMRRELIARLGTRQGDRVGSVRVVDGCMQDFAEPGQDLALCVFTVLAYILDDEALHASFAAASEALRPGGLFLLDVPHGEVFQSFDHDDDIMIRRVDVELTAPGRYTYREATALRTSDGIVRFDDHFDLRQWSMDEVLSALTARGFRAKADVSGRFAGLGADYLLMERV